MVFQLISKPAFLFGGKELNSSGRGREIGVVLGVRIQQKQHGQEINHKASKHRVDLAKRGKR
jgi:hypothetical protein